MKHIKTFESFLYEAKLANAHPFLDGADLDLANIQQFYVEPHNVYLQINSGDDAKDMQALKGISVDIKKMIPGTVKVYVEPWYVDKGGMGAGKRKKPGSEYKYTSMQLVYNADVIEPDYQVEFAHKFDPSVLKK